MVIYCADTSSFIEGWVRSYPIELFPRLWQRMEALIAERRLIAPVEVKHELERRTDSLVEWVKQQAGLFQPLETDVMEAVAAVMERFPRLVDTRRNRSGGDPFVIALAQVRQAVVLTQEHHSNTLEKPRIPDVCDALGVPYINLLDLIRRERWTF